MVRSPQDDRGHLAMSSNPSWGPAFPRSLQHLKSSEFLLRSRSLGVSEYGERVSTSRHIHNLILQNSSVGVCFRLAHHVLVSTIVNSSCDSRLELGSGRCWPVAPNQYITLVKNIILIIKMLWHSNSRRRSLGLVQRKRKRELAMYILSANQTKTGLQGSSFIPVIWRSLTP